MNKIKEELLKTAGNVTKSKQRVIVEVERQLDEAPRQKGTNKWIPAIVVVFALITFVLMSPKLLETDEKLSTASFAAFDEELFELGKERYIAYDWPEEDAIDSMNSFYTEFVLLEAYAKHHNITVTKKDIDAAYKEMKEGQLFNELEEKIIQHYEQQGLSEKDYDQLLRQLLSKEKALETKLIEPIAEKYTSFKHSAHEFLLQLEVHEYFHGNYEDEYFALLEETKVHTPLFGNSADKGVVLLVKEEAVLYLSEHQQLFYDSGAPIRWAPKRDGWNVRPGDIVTAYYTNSYSLDENEAQGGYPNVAFVKSMEVQDGSKRFEVNNDKLENFEKSLDWEESTTKFEGNPTYVVTDNINVYSGYISNDRTKVTWLHDGLETSITMEDTLELLLNVTSR